MKKDAINKANDLIFSIQRLEKAIDTIKCKDSSVGFYANPYNKFPLFDGSRHDGREFIEFKIRTLDGLKQVMLEYFEKELSKLEKELEEL